MRTQAQPYFSDCDCVEEEIHRLLAAGFSLLPLGAGPEGKAPLIRFSKIDRLQPRQILGPMRDNQSRIYGIRLDGLAVLDLDINDENLLIELDKRFGPSSVQVMTPRGRHLYYLVPSGDLPNLRQEKMPVDVKSGPNAYVVGPGSIRRSGARYVYASDDRLGEAELTKLFVEAEGVDTAEGSRIAKGHRNDYLTNRAIHMVKQVDNFQELFESLQGLRDVGCVDPQTVPDSEIRKIAEWAWGKRLKNSVYAGRNSTFPIYRNALDLMQTARRPSDVIVLYVILVEQHGHKPGRPFSLVHEGMREARLTDLSRRRFRAARQELEGLGLLQKVSNPIRGKAHTQYRLSRPLPDAIARLPQ